MLGRTYLQTFAAQDTGFFVYLRIEEALLIRLHGDGIYRADGFTAAAAHTIDHTGYGGFFGHKELAYRMLLLPELLQYRGKQLILL